VNGRALLHVTNALRARLKSALDASGVPGTVFVGSLGDADANGAALILFLYRVEPHASLRNDEHRVASGTAASPVDVFRNSLPLNLYFLVTVGTLPGSSEETLLGALGFAMQALQADPELTGASLDHEAVHLSLESLGTEELSRIWALFPTANYRTSIVYLATPVWIDPLLPLAASKPVTEDSLFAGAKVAETPP
jgi:Pvc16 N-terminal domain